MNLIEEFLKGELDASDFMIILKTDDDLAESMQKLIPQDAISDPEHVFWKECMLRSGLECYNFNVRSMLYSHYGYADSEQDKEEIFRFTKRLCPSRSKIEV